MFYLDDWAWAVLCFVSSWVGFMSVLTYLVMQLLQFVALQVPNNLHAKYNARWALVTGASSGIGRELVELLAGQGVSVVMVALEDQLLTSSFAELTKKYSSVAFRRCGCDLSKTCETFMPMILNCTEDIHISLLFNNAGFILPGFFAESDYVKVRGNFECNCGSILPITHHFVRLMIERQRRGLVAFTSSSAGYFPGPTATLYSSTKAFMTNFAASLAAEVKDAGVDVVIMHPSPVDTNFYKNTASQMKSLEQAQKAAVSPRVIAQQIIAAAGRITVWDQGMVSFLFRSVNKVLDMAMMWELVVRFARVNGDHQRFAKASKLRNKKEK